MVLSMTSYGRASATLSDQNITIEVKTLNSKFVDLRLKLPPGLQEYEMHLRKVLSDKIIRGKIEATFTFENQSTESFAINENAFKVYYQQLNSLATDLNLDQSAMLSTIIRLPEVISTAQQTISKEDWITVQSALDLCLDNLTAHREEEGGAIEKDMRFQVNFILQEMAKILPHEKDRVEKVRQRMNSSLEDYLSRDNIDENRLEQELLFYLEKMDITEEKVRLKQHCDYFLQELSTRDAGKGRKLNFISQEIGREVNTLGAKAYSSDIQKHVVLMKDALEKIKEQLANVV